MKTASTIAAGLILLAAGSAGAATSSITFTETGQQLNQAPGRNVALGDFNRDGTLDAFVVNHADYRVYFGDGHGQFTDSGQRLTCPAGWTIPTVGDIDRDGDLDVVTGRTAWLNDGQGRFTARNDAIETTEDGKLSGRLADLNGDGHLDFFAIRNLNAMRAYLNDGHGRFHDTGQRLGDGAIGKGQLTLIALGDIDGNGSIDAVTAGWRWDGSTECPNHVWLNDGTGNFRDSGQLLDEGASHVHGLALGDVNGDGRLDLVMGIQDPNRGGRVYLNDGNGRFVAGDDLAGAGANNIALADFDGDGRLDVFLTCSQQPNVVCLNDGNGHFHDSGLRLGPARDWSWDVATDDFNADDKPDAFVVTCRSFMQPAPAQIWLNTTTANEGGSRPQTPTCP